MVAEVGENFVSIQLFCVVGLSLYMCVCVKFVLFFCRHCTPHMSWPQISNATRNWFSLSKRPHINRIQFPLLQHPNKMYFMWQCYQLIDLEDLRLTKIQWKSYTKNEEHKNCGWFKEEKKEHIGATYNFCIHNHKAKTNEIKKAEQQQEQTSNKNRNGHERRKKS